jgi:hypothetical protein
VAETLVSARKLASVLTVSVAELDFGPYVPLFRIGAGGMGEVYAAKARHGAGAEQLVASWNLSWARIS